MVLNLQTADCHRCQFTMSNITSAHRSVALHITEYTNFSAFSNVFDMDFKLKGALDQIHAVDNPNAILNPYSEFVEEKTAYKNRSINAILLSLWSIVIFHRNEWERERRGAGKESSNIQ